MRRRFAALLGMPLVLGAAPQENAGTAVSLVKSAAPEAVAVTVYRSPYGSGAGAQDLQWLNGFALITETRTLNLPAGPATIRFEGVAGGIVPASAIVGGLPGGVIEKNRDERLLSPAALASGYLGRRVTLTRTDRASGRRRTQDATIVAGPANGIVVRTPDGVEALGCSGLAEATRYPSVPADLTAGPVLAVSTNSSAARAVTVTLSYLTSEFDWSASYVATMAPDGRTLDLFAWLTLANGNAESFPAAQLQAVAGRLNHRDERFRVFTRPLQLSCFPLGTTTSDLPDRSAEQAEASEDIVVTGMRMMAVPAPPPVEEAPPPPPPAPEDLGDLKLYRAPERVTVSARGQKQVALLARSRVPFQRLYRFTLPPLAVVPLSPSSIVLRLNNRADAGLGIPLPAGSTTLYAQRGREKLLVGTGSLSDKAVGETVRIAAGQSAQVLVSQSTPERGHGEVTVTNANPFAVCTEIAVQAPPANVRASASLATVDGLPTWTVSVPANGSRTLTYTMRN
ncbi:DUF4139 domain-containing protein [Sphingomonas aerophila]|uniref:DUF4139 domain-containing protein n=1 Tax=Sphingomonas aerophila TaxID=1344948 RepID=A0A7W9BAI9_9SPHN|nr:hypothetical protein [Sphingomonas aerophila]MBB5713620.1 hypothetical protein [Sphingomonas aerophila]